MISEQAKQKRNIICEEDFKKRGWCPTEGYVMNWQAGFDQGYQFAKLENGEQYLHMKKICNSRYKEIQTLEAIIQKLENALGYYANYNNYCEQNFSSTSERCVLKQEDCEPVLSELLCAGKLARQALAETKEMKGKL